MFQISFSSHGDRAFNKLPHAIQQQVIETLGSLTNDVHWYRRVKKLKGTKDQYRFRIGRWRVLFLLINNRVEVLDIFMKKGEEDYRRRGL